MTTQRPRPETSSRPTASVPILGLISAAVLLVVLLASLGSDKPGSRDVMTAANGVVFFATDGDVAPASEFDMGGAANVADGMALGAAGAQDPVDTAAEPASTPTQIPLQAPVPTTVATLAPAVPAVPEGLPARPTATSLALVPAVPLETETPEPATLPLDVADATPTTTTAASMTEKADTGDNTAPTTGAFSNPTNAEAALSNEPTDETSSTVEFSDDSTESTTDDQNDSADNDNTDNNSTDDETTSGAQAAVRATTTAQAAGATTLTTSATVEPTASPVPTEAPTSAPEPTATPQPTATVTPLPTPTTLAAASPASLEQYVLAELNDVRQRNGLAALTLSPEVSLISREWSAQMAANGSISHRDAAALGLMLPRNWRAWGENVAVGPDAQQAQNALELSPGHFKNMVDPRFTHVGVGIVVRDGYTWITQNFVGF